MTQPAEATTGTVRLVDGWIEVAFGADARITQALRRVDGRRLEAGRWRVAEARGAELARELVALGLEWADEALALYEAEVERSGRWHAENALALEIKQGTAEGDWDVPVALLPHQRTGASFLAARSGALLCDEQGLGKTLTCLAAFWLVRRGMPDACLFVVCPNSLKHTWATEVQRFFPDWRVALASGPRRSRVRSYESTADIYITNYEAVRSDRAEVRWLLRTAPTILVCDEAHALKNRAAETTRALQFVRPPAMKAWLMTGTPVPNKAADIFTQVTLADGGRTLGTWATFDAHYGRADDDPVVLGNLQRSLDPIVLRRTKDQVLDLPERVFEQRRVELRGAQLRMYEEMRDGIRDTVSAMSDDEFGAKQQTVLVRLLRLSQIASNPRLVDPTFSGVPAKVREIDDLLAQLIGGNGRKVVLWSYYVQTIQELLERYRRYSPVAVYGGVELALRGEAVRRFQEDDEVKLLIGNPQAAGSGLTLTAAPYAIYETVNWRYDLYAQSLDRIHRIGQDRNVTYFEILAADSIDVHMRERLHEKGQFAAELLGDTATTQSLERSEVLRMLRP